jgi:rubrerythrin
MSSLPSEVPADFGAALARLARTERLDLDDMKLLILLELAGEPLYARLADHVAPAEAKDLLLQNGREETAHAHRLKRAIEKKTGTPYTLPSLDENPYAVPPAFASVNAALLAGVQQGESGGGSDYQRYADHEPDPEIAEWLRQNGREELRHRDRVTRVIEILGRA